MNIISLIKKYKSSVTRKYIFVSKDEIETIPKNDLFISKKIDGQLWFYCKSDKNSKIINSNENEISDVIQDIKKDLDKKLKKLPINLFPLLENVVMLKIKIIMST